MQILEVINCFVSNFDEAEVTFTYNQQGEIGDLQLAVEFGGQAVTEALTLDETDPTDPELTDNYVIAGSCNVSIVAPSSMTLMQHR